MTDDMKYSSHREQFAGAQPDDKRIKLLRRALKKAFSKHIKEKTVGYIQFDQVSVDELKEAFFNYPILIKSILACINVAKRAVKRDLQIDIDTYTQKITKDKAAALAGYIKPMMPKELAIPALVELDRYFWIDKTMRKIKGSWEKEILKFVNIHATQTFKKRKFSVADHDYE